MALQTGSDTQLWHEVEDTLFSAFKSRGFWHIADKLKQADRIAQLILILIMATYFTVSTAMKPDPKAPKYTPKNPIAA